MDKNEFAKAPPMGWNSYDYYNTSVTEEQIRANADYMAKNLKQFGWEYIVVDIEWYSNDAGTNPHFQYIPFGDDEMDEYGRLLPSPNRFPSSVDGKGFGPLAEYVHSLGLKFGIHIMRGIPRKAAHMHCKVQGTNETADMIADPSSVCLWNPDMYGVRNTTAGQAYYDSIISMYADWGVDFIKCDDICDSRLYRDNPFLGWDETVMIYHAIQKTHRPMVLSLSPGPAHIDRAWEYSKYANMWRITDDFWDDWNLLKAMFERCEKWQDHVDAGCFPDCDMLPVGKLGKGFDALRNTNFTLEEQKTMLTLWCIFRSPLMLGADLPQLDDETLALLTNKDILEMLSPDCRGKQVLRTENEAVWCSKNALTGKCYVALFNLSDGKKDIAVSEEQLDACLGEKCCLKDKVLLELWNKTSSASNGAELTTKVSAHGVAVYSF